MSRGYRRYKKSSAGRAPKKFGGKPSPAQLHKQMNTKDKKSKEPAVQPYLFRLVVIDFAGPSDAARLAKDGVSAFRAEVMRKLSAKEDVFKYFADIESKQGRAVFIVKLNPEDKSKTVEFNVLGIRINGAFSWARIDVVKRKFTRSK